MAKVLLGQSVIDCITGFKGVVLGRVEYISGCNQVLVQPKVDKTGAPRDSLWIDEQRVQVDPKVKRVVLDNGQTPGFDKAPPKR